METTKEAWSEGLQRSSEIIWLLNSSTFVQRNIEFKTKIYSNIKQELKQQTWTTGIDNSRLKLLAILLSISAYIE